MTIDVGTIMKEYDPVLHGVIPEAEYMRQRQSKNSSGDSLYKPFIMDLYAEQASADAAADVIEDLDAELDGTAAAIDVYLYSKDAKDAVAGVGARSVTLLAIVGDEYVESALVPAGLNTQSTDKLEDVQRLINGRVTAAGTELDNAGEIDITNNAQAATYMGIQAGENRLRTCVFWIAPGYRCKVVKLVARNATAAGAGTLANTIVEGVRVRLVQTLADLNQTAAIPTSVVRFNLNLYAGQAPCEDIADRFPEVFPLDGVDTGIVKLALNIESMDDGDHTTAQYFMRLLVWREE